MLNLQKFWISLGGLGTAFESQTAFEWPWNANLGDQTALRWPWNGVLGALIEKHPSGWLGVGTAFSAFNGVSGPSGSSAIRSPEVALERRLEPQR